MRGRLSFRHPDAFEVILTSSASFDVCHLPMSSARRAGASQEALLALLRQVFRVFKRI